MTDPTPPRRYLRVLKGFIFLTLITLAVVGILLTSLAGLLYLLGVAFAGRTGPGAGVWVVLLLGLLATFGTVIVLSFIGLGRKSNKLLYISTILTISGLSAFVFLPGFRFASDMAAEQLHVWPVNYERVNFPLAVRKEREIVGPGDRPPLQLAWSPDGSRIAATINPGVPTMVWDRSGRELSRFKTDALTMLHANSSLAFISGASQVLSACCQNAQGDHPLLNIFDVATGQRVRAIDSPKPETWFLASPLSVSADQEHVAMAMAMSDEVVIASTKDWAFGNPYVVHQGPSSIAYAANSRDLVVGSMDGIVTEIDTASASQPREWHAFLESGGNPPEVMSIAASPDGKFIFAGGQSNTDSEPAPAVLVRAADGVRVASFPGARGQQIEQAIWDPQGRFVAILDGANNVYLWRPFAPTLSYAKITLPGLTGRINCMAISADGDHIAASTERGFIILSVRTP